MIWAYVCIVLIVVSLYLWAVVSFNNVVRIRNHVLLSWQIVDNMFDRRNAIVNELCELWQRYAEHPLPPSGEHLQDLLSHDIDLDWNDVPKRTSLQKSISYACTQFLENAKRSPVISGMVEFTQLQEYLQHVNEELARTIKLYNTTALRYNEELTTFPHDVMAPRLGYSIAAICRMDV